MKEKDAHVAHGHQLVLYVEREDASYGPVQTGAYLVSEFIDDYLAKREAYRRDCLRRLEQGEISPVAYYLLVLNLTEADLAARAGISRRKVRRHLDPRGFLEVGLELARRYAEIFGVPLANLFQVLVAEGEGLEVGQEPTANPAVTRTRFRRGAGAPPAAGGGGEGR